MATPLQLTGLKPQPGFHCSHRTSLSYVHVHVHHRVGLYFFLFCLCICSTHINVLLRLYAVYGHNRQKRKKKHYRWRFFSAVFYKSCFKDVFFNSLTVMQMGPLAHLKHKSNQVILFMFFQEFKWIHFPSLSIVLLFLYYKF